MALDPQTILAEIGSYHEHLAELERELTAAYDRRYVSRNQDQAMAPCTTTREVHNAQLRPLRDRRY